MITIIHKLWAFLSNCGWPMTIYTDEIAGQTFLEPVGLDAVKKYIGYDPGINENDQFLNEEIISSRAALEDWFGRAIVRRKFVTHFYDVKTNDRMRIPLMKPLRTVLKVESVDASGNVAHSITSYTVRPGDGASVFVDPIAGIVTEIIVTYESGYDEAPPMLKTAIMMLVKARYERSTDDVIGQLRQYFQKYMNVNI